MSDLVSVGRVGRPHGLDGSFAVEDASDVPDRFAPGATLYAGTEPARVVESKRARGRPVIRLDRPVERGTELSVPRSSLPPPEEGSFYAFDLVGLAVEEEGGSVLGRVRRVAPGRANDVLELDTGVDLPLAQPCVRSIDLEAGRILVVRGFADSR